VGEETGRRWEQGEDLSLVEFKSFEYQQSKQVVAGEDIKESILKIGIRKLERDTGVSHHTLDKILIGEAVRRKTLAKIVKQLPHYRETDTDAGESLRVWRASANWLAAPG
jgi:predicted transcriptional regulator